MNNINQLESNIKTSFRDVKLDMISVKGQILRIAEGQKELKDLILSLKKQNKKPAKKPVKKKVVKKKVVKKKPVKKKVVKKAKPKVVKKKVVKKVAPKVVKKKPVKHKHAQFIGSKEGKKLHILACPFAKNIKPKSRVMFKTKNKALNEGYKPCECMKKI